MCDHIFHLLTNATAIQKIKKFSIPFVKAYKSVITTTAKQNSPGSMN